VREGVLTPGELRCRYRPIYPDVHVPRAVAPTLHDRTNGAWLWSRRRGVITGSAAAALHGSRWIDDLAPIELIWSNNHPPSGVITRNERIGDDEIMSVDGMHVTIPARTAFDLGRFLRRDQAVAHLDALANARIIRPADVLTLAERYAGARGAKKCRTAVELMDAGAQSPKETWLRLLVIDAGYPRPRTQIPVLDDDGFAFAYLDLGWDDVMIALEYDGEHHRTDPMQYRKDIRRIEAIQRQGWIVIRVIAGDRAEDILERLGSAWLSRGDPYVPPSRRSA
jgi:hypothetical protein